MEYLPEAVPRPVLVVVSGLPGTGKSYFCRRLAERLPSVILESDALRKVLFSSPSYSQAESARLFRAIRLLVGRLLAGGISVIVDATNLTERYRGYFYSVADRRGVKLILARIEAPPEVVRKRMEARQANAEERSDASWEVYQKMKDSVEIIGRRHYVADTSRDIAPVIDRIIREADRQK
ncbi:MAG: ATP-binding protein [Dehalococcoidales bacterium]|nr:ATP-binding protein [Dehalococcoidales bacterium]